MRINNAKLKKIRGKVSWVFNVGVYKRRYNIDYVKLTEKLFAESEAIYIAFGFLEYFLVIEDKKPVLYVRASTRMDLDMVAFIDEDGIEQYDIFDDNKDMCERYYGNFKKVKRFKDLKFINIEKSK